MAEENDQEKTEEPTQKRIEEFQDKGQFGQSREIASMGVLFGGLAFLYYGLNDLLRGIMDFMRASFGGIDRPINAHSVSMLVNQAQNTVGMSMLILMLVLGLVSLLTVYGQIGWHPNPEGVSLNLERLNPLPGIKRLFSIKESGIELAKSFLKLFVVGFIGYQLLKRDLVQIIEMPRTGMKASFQYMAELLYSFTLRCLLWLGVISVLDLIWQRRSLHQKMMMSKQEVKDENREKEGDPRVKAQQRRIARSRLQKSGIQDVPKADVVVTNPDHYAIALQYTAGKMRAPKVIAKGQDRVAEAIKTEARRLGIPRVENRLLARTLYKLTKVGDEVPPQVYAAVAEVLAFVYRLKQQQQHF